MNAYRAGNCPQVARHAGCGSPPIADDGGMADDGAKQHEEGEVRRDERGRILPGSRVPALMKNRWKPGQSGNPTGRPNGKRLTARLLRALDADNGALADALIDVMTARAKKGDFRFFQELYNRTEGKVADRLAGADGETLKTYVNVDVGRVCRKKPQS